MKAKRIIKAAGLAVLLGLAAGPALAAQDINDTIDGTIRGIRESQNQDGSYGADAVKTETTALVLLGLAASPRRYTDADGPFVRNGAEWLVAAQLEDGSFLTGSGGNTLEATALAVAALERVNAARFKQHVARGKGYLAGRLAAPVEGLLSSTGFIVALALEKSHPESVAAVADALRGDGPEDLFRNTCLLLAGKDIAADFAASWTQSLVEQPDGTRELTPFHLLAACTLFSHQEKQGAAPPLWADRLSGVMLAMLGGPGAPVSGEPPPLEDRALLVAALSLCDQSGEKAPPSAAGFEEAPPLPEIVKEPLALRDALARSLDFLAKNQKDGAFGFMGFSDPGITAMALSASMKASRVMGREIPSYVPQGLEWLKSLQKDDGSVYLTGLKTYVTSVALMAFQDSGDPAYAEAIEAAKRFLIVIQSDEGEGYSMEDDPLYGGMGYGGDERPDLSNTQMAMDALRAAGVDEKHESFQKALNFIKKCQNLAEVEPTEVVLGDGKKVVSGTDGGGIYYPGDSKAGLEEIDSGVFVARSYGSMTYALLKSLIFAGLDPEDKRVKAAVKWIEKHYTLEENPGFELTNDPSVSQQGLFYYYLTMARALDALGQETIQDSAGTPRRWRRELEDKLLSIQRVDGSWINERSPRWFEGNPVLATSYALLTLDICAQKP